MDILISLLLMIAVSTLIWILISVRKLKSNNEHFFSKLDETNNNKLINDLNKKLESLLDQLTQLNRENTEQWHIEASNIKEQEKRLEYFEAAARRFPNKKEFIQEIREILDPLANASENLLVRREALMRLRDHANHLSQKFYSIDDLQENFAQKLG